MEDSNLVTRQRTILRLWPVWNWVNHYLIFGDYTYFSYAILLRMSYSFLQIKWTKLLISDAVLWSAHGAVSLHQFGFKQVEISGHVQVGMSSQFHIQIQMHFKLYASWFKNCDVWFTFVNHDIGNKIITFDQGYCLHYGFFHVIQIYSEFIFHPYPPWVCFGFQFNRYGLTGRIEYKARILTFRCSQNETVLYF